MLFNINMPSIINSAMGSLLLTGTMVKVTRGPRTDGSLTAGPSTTETSYTFKGFYDEYKDGVIDGVLIKNGDRKVMILSASCPAVPSVGDKITLEGETKIIVSINTDPARATYSCQVR